MKKILILLTNHATLGEAELENGTYAPELTHAVHEFQEAGIGYDFVSIKGGAAPIYGTDIEDGVNDVLLRDKGFLAQVANTLAVADIDPSDYSAVFYPGGYGILYDLAFDEKVAKLVAGLYEGGAPIGAVCHGPAGFLPITLSDGSKILDGKHVTGFTREEEIDYETIDHIPFLLEEKLARTAGKYSKVAPWAVHVIEDGQLISGQNPASAGPVGQAIIGQLKNN